MRLAIITPSASRLAGGLFNSVRRGAIELVQSGVDVRVYAARDAFTEVDLPFWGSVPVMPYKALGPASLGLNPRLSNELRMAQPDVVHLHGLWTFQSVVTRYASRPVVISPRGMLDPWAVRNSRMKKTVFHALLEEANLRRAACIHALNRDEAAAIRAFGCKAPIATVPNGIDLPVDDKPPPPDWLAPDGRKVLLFIGRIHPKKGIEELVRAWALLRSAAPALHREWRLVVAGWDDGGHLKRLRRLVGDLGLDGDVLFPGSIYHNAKHALLAHSHAFILPSYSEGLPMSVLEAWAYGLPTFMTEFCNLSFAFGRGGAIQITPQPGNIAEVLGCWLGSDSLAERGAQGRTIAEADYGWGKISLDMIAVYEWLAGRGKRPGCVQVD